MAASHSWEETKERVREAADIVQVIGEHVQLRRAGGHFTGLCPFHSEKTPSFSVNPQRQSFHCFGCGESGDVFSFLMKYQNVSFPEALKELAGRCQISLPEPQLNEAEVKRRQQRELLGQINTEAAKLYAKYLVEAQEAEAARHYLRRRGVPQEFIECYQLGYAPNEWDFLSSRLAKQFSPELIEEAGLIAAKKRGGWYDRFRDRIMFPIHDLRGRIVAFGGRILGEGQPKYMNSPESLIFEKSKVLFGLHPHRDALRQSRRAVIVEGNFDLLLLAVHGIANTVAPLGTALTREHIRTLRSYCSEAVLLFDGDAAGLKAARRSIPLFLAEQLEAKAALLPPGHDPDSFIREQGAKAVQELLAAASPLPEFLFDALVQEHGLTLSGKSRIMAELTELVQQAPDRAQRELMAAHFAGKLDIQPELFFSGDEPPRQTEAPPMPQPSEFAPLPEPEREPVRLPAAQRLLLEFLVLYPEHFGELAAGGLLEYVNGCATPVQEAVAAMRRLAAAGALMPEQLLSALPDGAARQQVAEIVLRGAADAPDDEEQGRALCAELLAWLEAEKKKQESMKLEIQVRQVEQAGDYRQSDELRRQIHLIRAEKLSSVS